MQFTWVPFYKELAAKLLAFADRSNELVDMVESALVEVGLGTDWLQDKAANGDRHKLSEIDPFTFFATFNRRITEAKRIEILGILKASLGVVAAVPSDFAGIPVVDNRNSLFCNWEKTRPTDHISSLWQLAKACVEGTPEEMSAALYEKAVDQVGAAKITVGLFWLNPDLYLSLDNLMFRDLYPKQNAAATKSIRSIAGYREAIEVFKRKHGESSLFYEVSYDIYARKQISYWVFQANLARYDFVGALRDGKLDNWTIKTHKDDISQGDRVILWGTGAKGGCYALCEVTTDLLETSEPQGDFKYFREQPQSGPYHYVGLSVLHNIWNKPVTKNMMAGNRALLDLNVGRQGTVFRATQSQYDALLKLAEPAGGDRKGCSYWMYAPGPQAKHWDDCWAKGEMVLGYDHLGDLGSYAKHEDVVHALQEHLGTEKSCKNNALACWQFVHDVRPGDMVFVKKGKTAYLGYGVVTGGYEYDTSRPSYRSVRKVDWKAKGSWPEKDGPIVLKTLTDISKYPEYVEKLKKLLGVDMQATPKRKVDLPAKNIILFGPPGTGKTYALRTEYMNLFTEAKGIKSREQFAQELVESLSWWEVITLVMFELESAKVAQILSHPLMAARIARSENRNPRAAVWAHLQMHTKRDCETVAYTRRYEPLMFSKSDTSVWSIDRTIAQAEVPELLQKLDAYNNFQPSQGAYIKRYVFTTFHQSFSYEDFIEGIKPVMGDEVAGDLAYEMRSGVFKQIAQRARMDTANDYAIFIDEINRGNVASIFGELITLLEDDKRLGATNELTTTLPYSHDVFVVPSNLYVIGTMNTADRSVEALDTALRRRFTFLPCRPDPELLGKYQPESLGVELEKLLVTINARIERLLDDDHCIGHSYFMGLRDMEDPLEGLRHVFANKVLPLLQEYFYGDPARVGMVLGKEFVKRRQDACDLAQGPWDPDGIDEREVYDFSDPMELPEEAFVSIYA